MSARVRPTGTAATQTRAAVAASTKADRRQQILLRARDAFAKRGYHAAKIDEIVATAGIARGTFYLYFADKRSIFEELVDRFAARLGLAIERIDPHDPARTVETQTRDNIRRLLAVLLGDRPMTKILLADVVGVDPSFDGKLLSFYDEMATLFFESLSDGQALGVVREGDVRLFAYFTMGGLKEVLLQVVTRDLLYDTETLVDAIYGILRHGYLAAKTGLPVVG